MIYFLRNSFSYEKNKFLSALVIFALIFVSIPALSRSKRKTVTWLEGKIVGVSDGDTVKLLDSENTEHKIRLLGIDAPEKKQDFGEVSKQNLSRLVFGKEIKVRVQKKDRYGRSLGVLIEQGQDVNIQQIQAGLAWHYKHFQSDQLPDERVSYSAAEELARKNKTGLWTLANPTPPWDFRREGKRNPASHKKQKPKFRF